MQDLLSSHPFARIGRYFGGIIHNLNGRLQCALLQVELLQMPLRVGTSPPDPEQVERRLKNLTAELDCLSEMLRFWGQQVDYDSLVREGWVDVNQIVNKALTFMHADLFFKHQVSTEIHLQEGLPMIYGNEFALANVFGPLLENAVEAMRHSDQRKLVVATSNEGPEVMVAIEHTGCLLQERADDDLFCSPLKVELSSEASGCRNALHRRLGLYLASHLAKAYGGSIIHKNGAECSIFKTHLPIKHNCASGMAAEAVRNVPPPGLE
jgi:C4-dicarboxylate-specific signal transduction histidine kinase